MGPLRIVVLIAALILGAAAAWYFWQGRAPEAPSRAEVPAAPPLPVAQAPKYPIPPAQSPLPALKESDSAMAEALAGLVGADAVKKLFFVEDFVRRIVATVDNLPRRSYAARLNPVRGPGGAFRTRGKDQTLAIAPENGARYAPYLALAQSVDPARLAAAYVRFYPLFQDAYVELGYPNGYFNDRLVEVIDHLLATPEVREPVLLVVPHVLYEFADPELEDRSAGQKVLLRMGTENAAKARAWLKALRSEVLAQVAKK